MFILGYALAAVVLVPAAWMTLAGGAIFGIVRGAAYSFLGAVLGSSLAFLIARYGARRFVASAVESRPRVAAVERAVSARGLPLVFLLRMSPLVPFNVLNYALGLTTIRFRDALVASLGMLPACVAYAYAGRVAGETAALAGKAAPPHDASYYVLLASGLIATAGVVLLVTRAARQALHDV